MKSLSPFTARFAAPACLVILLLLGLALRLFELGSKSLWYDEAVLWQVSRASLSGLGSANSQLNSAPPLFPLIVKLVGGISDSEAMLRLVPFLAGTLAIPAVYFLARSWLTQRGALLAALLLTVSYRQVLLAQQVREYSLVLLLTALILGLFVRFVKRNDGRSLVLATALMAVGVLLQYGVPLLIFSLNLTFLFVVLLGRLNADAKRTLMRRWVTSQAVVLVAAVVVVLVSLRQQFGAGSFGDDYLAGGYWRLGSLTSLAHLVVVNSATTLNLAVGLPLFVLALPLVALGTWQGLMPFTSNPLRWPGIAMSDKLLLCLLVLPPLVTLGLAMLRFYPYIGGRQDIFLVPMLYVVAGLGFEKLLEGGVRQLRVATALVAGIAVIGLWASISHDIRPGTEEVRPLVAYLQENPRGDATLYVYKDAIPAFNYYTRHDRPAGVILGSELADGHELPELASVLQQQGNILLIVSHIVPDDQQRFVEAVSSQDRIEETHAENGASLFLAVPKATSAP